MRIINGKIKDCKCKKLIKEVVPEATEEDRYLILNICYKDFHDRLFDRYYVFDKKIRKYAIKNKDRHFKHASEIMKKLWDIRAGGRG